MLIYLYNSIIVLIIDMSEVPYIGHRYIW